MAVGVVGPHGRILGRSKKKTKARERQAVVLGRIVDAVNDACLDANVDRSRIAAVGIGAPSAIDIPRGVVINSGNLRWKNVRLRELLTRRFKVPVVVDNDVNVACWGEVCYGNAKGKPNVLAVWVGTGVGGALVLGGKLWYGPTFTAGEIGQTILFPSAPPGHRTVEEHCSRNGIVAAMRMRAGFHPRSRFHPLAAREVKGDPIGSAELALMMRARDPLAMEVIESAASLLGVAIANQVSMLSIDSVIIGGGVAEALGSPFARLVTKSFRENVFPETLRRCTIQLTKLGPDAGVIGAAELAREKL